MFLLVPAYPGSPGSKAVKRLCVCVRARACVCVYAGAFGPCISLYDRMDVKHIQHDSLG